MPLSLQCTEAPTAHQGQSALPHGAEETPCAPGGKAFQSLADKGTCIQNSSISRPPNQPPSFEKKFGNKPSQSHLRKSSCIRKFGFVGSAGTQFPSEQHLQQHRSAHQMFDVIWGRMTSTGALQPARAGYTHSVGLGSDSFAISVILNRTEKLLNQLSHN